MKSPWHSTHPPIPRLETEDGPSTEAVPLLDDPEKAARFRHEHRTDRSILLPWTLALFFGLLALVQFLVSPPPITYSYEYGFTTEFEDAFPAISVVRRRFGAAPINSTAEQGREQVHATYTGPNSPIVEASWTVFDNLPLINLTRPEILRLNHDRVLQNLTHFPEDFQAGLGGGHYATVGMVQQLQCLNVVRRYVESGYRGKWQPRESVDACVEVLRRAVMCYGDMTPVTMRADKEGGVWGEAGRIRTCRNAEKLLQYVRDRGEQDSERGEETAITGEE